MKGKNTLRLLAFTISLGLCASSLHALPMAIANPGAEEAKPGHPDQAAVTGTWASEGVIAQFSRDTTTYHGGQAAYHILNRGIQNPKQVSRTAVYIISGPVIGGLRYTATAWLKTRDAIEAQISVRLKSADGFWIDDPTCSTDLLTGSHDWTKVKCTWSGIRGATAFNLFLRVGVSGEAWFDDIEVSDDFEDSEQMAAFWSLCDQAGQVLNSVKNWPYSFGKEVAADALVQLEPLNRETTEYRKTLDSWLKEGTVPMTIRAKRSELTTNLKTALLTSQRLVGLSRAIGASQTRGSTYLAGWASPATHIFLRDCPAPFQAGSAGRILAVKGETEALQLVVFPIKRSLEKVNIVIGPLKNPSGNSIPADRVIVNPVGFVKTTVQPLTGVVPVEHEYLGWWPDPLLDNFAFDVRLGDTQPVWISVSVPKDQPAGKYTGQVRIEPAQEPSYQLPLEVEVANFTLPGSGRWAFKNVLSWHQEHAERFYGTRWNADMERRFFDFLLDRRINLVSTYGDEPYETVENLKRFADRGQNVFFLKWYNQSAEVIASDAAGMREQLNQFYPAVKQLDLLRNSYVYGWDEIGEPATMPGMYDQFRYAAEILKKDYPGVRLLSAGTDRSYGTDSPLKGLNNLAFCPAMKYDPRRAQQAHLNGNEVWWYDTEWTIDQPLLRSRLIPWQTFKLGADGFLLWCVNRWRNNDKPIGKQILADWNPALDNVCANSSAMYVYPGENGPVSSLRLENFRDGMEDYELLVTARGLLNRVSDPTVKARLAEVISIDNSLTSDLTHFAANPGLLFEQRERLIRALEKTTDR